MPLVDMRSPVWPHVRANHPAPCADHPRAEPHIRPGSLTEQMHRRAQARRRAVAINANERELHALGIQIQALESRLNELEDQRLPWGVLEGEKPAELRERRVLFIETCECRDMRPAL